MIQRNKLNRRLTVSGLISDPFQLLSRVKLTEVKKQMKNRGSLKTQIKFSSKLKLWKMEATGLKWSKKKKLTKNKKKISNKKKMQAVLGSLWQKIRLLEVFLPEVSAKCCTE